MDSSDTSNTTTYYSIDKFNEKFWSNLFNGTNLLYLNFNFNFIAVLVFKLLNRKVLFINKKDNRNCLKADYF